MSDVPLSELRDIRRSFVSRGRKTHAVAGVSLTIGGGEILGLVGESGSGKSTVGRIATGLEKAQAGKLLINGQDVAELSRREAARAMRRCQMVFQDPYSSLNPRLTVGRQVAEGLRGAGWPDRQKIQDEVERLFHLVGLTPQQVDRYPHEFSGGQRQRIAIARALAPRPELHDIAVVANLCQRILVMHRGRIVEFGKSQDVVSGPVHPYTRSLLSAVPRLDRRRRGEPFLSPELPSQSPEATFEMISEDHGVFISGN